MVRNFKTQLAGDGVLAVLYFGVKKFFHMAAVQAHQVVMVPVSYTNLTLPPKRSG